MICLIGQQEWLRLAIKNMTFLSMRCRGDYNDPDWLSNFMQSGAHTFNKSADFKNDEVDRLLSEGRTTLDESARDEIYQELSELLLELSPHVYINWRSQTTGMNIKVQGFESRPGNLILSHPGLTLESLYIEE